MYSYIIDVIVMGRTTSRGKLLTLTLSIVSSILRFTVGSPVDNTDWEMGENLRELLGNDVKKR